MQDLTPSNLTPSNLGEYYRRRAAYYERVYAKPERQADLRAMEDWIARSLAGRHVLEIACGTGWWTVHGARACASWLATDLEPATLAVAQAKTLPAGVAFARVDAYALEALPAQRFDAVFAGCWWSHVPLQRLSDWVDALHARLQPGAFVVMLDNRFVAGSSTPIARCDAAGNTYQMRTLDDGSAHEVLKNFPEEGTLRALLGPRARGLAWTLWEHYWAATWTVPAV